MGYESRLYLVESHDHGISSEVFEQDEDGALVKDDKGDLIVTGKGRYTQVIAMVDLSKAGYDQPVSDLLAESRKAQKAVLASEAKPLPFGIYLGDKFAIEDPYGDPLAPVNLDALIAALETELSNEYRYRRFALALGILTTWRDLQADFPWTYVLHYGH